MGDRFQILNLGCTQTVDNVVLGLVATAVVTATRLGEFGDDDAAVDGMTKLP